jgi:DNA-binding transcriptional LysR family regulator
VNLSAIDIKLLLVFEAVMTERSVSRAAQELGMSQPTVSRSLNQLRRLFDDELFIRSPGGVMPTPRASDLAGPIHDVLMRLHRIVEPAGFVPETAIRTFHLAVSDHCSTLILPALEERLRQAAPGIELRIRPKVEPFFADELDAGEIDFALGVIRDLPPRLQHVTLFNESYVCVMRAAHPLAAAPLHYGDFVSADHLTVTHVGDVTQVVDTLLRARGISRRVVLSINQSLLAPVVLARSDLILTTFRHMVERLPAFAGLHVTPVPLDIKPVAIRLVWHGGLARHPAHDWLRRMIVDICAGFGGTAPAEPQRSA